MVTDLDGLAGPSSGAVPLSTVSIEQSADLMVDAYWGTVDWEDGDDATVAAHELRDVFDGESGAYLADASLSMLDDLGAPICVIACALYEGEPTILFVYTAAKYKRQGMAEALIRHSAAVLQAAGYERIFLFVTDTNPAKALYERLGFVEA
jgi:ribosomal protein S18 acetylase RimI-like enzyme